MFAVQHDTKHDQVPRFGSLFCFAGKTVEASFSTTLSAGRSHSKLSLTSVNEDANEFDERCQQLRTPSATGRVRVPETIEEALSPGRNSCDLGG